MNDPAPRPPIRALIYVLVFVSGLSVMLIEMTAPRLLGPFFGTSTVVWTNVIGVILLALSIGYYVGGRLADRRPHVTWLASIVMVGAALASIAPVAVPAIGRAVLEPGLGLGAAYGLIGRGSLVTAILVFFPPALLLAIVGPYAIRCLAEHDHVGRAAGTIYALGTIGSLAGTFLPTFWLIPTVGSRATILIACGTLFGIAAIVFVAHRRRAPVAGIGVLAIVGATLASGGPVRGGDDLIAEAESAYQYVRVSREEADGTTALLLQVNEPVADYQSRWVEGRVLTSAYYDHFALLPLLVPAREDRPLSVAIIGLAGGVISRQYHALYPDTRLHIDGVEVDGEVVRLAREHFGLDATHQPHTDVHVLDGRVFLARAPSRYDVIVVDAYASQIYLPPHLCTVDFFRLARERLHDDGVLALNVSAYAPDRGLLPGLTRTVARAFGEAFVAPTAPGNFVVFATAGGGTRRWPPTATRPVPEALGALWAGLTRPRTALRLPDRPDAAVFTDDDCPVERLADADLAAALAR